MNVTTELTGTVRFPYPNIPFLQPNRANAYVHLEGEHTFNANQPAVWDLLNDPDVLARATPGLKELRPLEEDRYEAVFEIKMGPINSNFVGTLEVVDKVAPESYRLLINVDGKIGKIAAEGAISTRSEEQQTLLSFQGDAKLTGILARMGQRVLSGVGRMFTKQFFQALESEIATKSRNTLRGGD